MDTCNQNSTVKYKQAASMLRTRIKTLGIAEGEMLGTESEFCREFQLSRKSIRRAVDSLVEENLVERRAGVGIFRTSPQKRITQFQIIVPGFSFEQWQRIAAGAKSVAEKNSSRLQVLDSHSSIDEDIEYIRSLPESFASGALLGAIHHPDFMRALFCLADKDYPFVVIDSCVGSELCPSVSADNYGGGYLAAQKIIEAGHHRVGFVGNLTAQTIKERLDGFKDAFLDAKILFDRSMVKDCSIATPMSDERPEIGRALKEMLECKDRPTAIFCGNDGIAIHALTILKDRNVAVPSDVSIVGFDGIRETTWTDPTIAGVSQPFEQMGQTAMSILLDRVNGKLVENEIRKLKIHWHEGNSLRKVR